MFIFLLSFGDCWVLHSFPTRRSSDLLSKLLSLISVDERAHHSFYLQVAKLYMERDRKGTIEALRRRSEEHTSELQSPVQLVCRLPLEKKNIQELMDAVDSAIPTP